MPGLRRRPAVVAGTSKDVTVDAGADAAPEAAAPVEETGPLAEARRRHQRVVDGVALEDAPRGSAPEDQKRPEDLVGAQIRAQLDAAAACRVAAEADPAQVSAYAAAVERLEAAYLASSLVSTDAWDGAAWAPDDYRDQLGNRGVDDKIRAWQAASELSCIKFAVVRAGDATVVRVGSMDAAHVEIAGGPALAAGLLRFDLDGPRPVAAELENVSGGFRPGPLRNATARAAIIAAGYASAAGLDVYANATGTYGSSHMEQ